jgi:hypothetical protein
LPASAQTGGFSEPVIGGRLFAAGSGQVVLTLLGSTVKRLDRGAEIGSIVYTLELGFRYGPGPIDVAAPRLLTARSGQEPAAGTTVDVTAKATLDGGGFEPGTELVFIMVPDSTHASATGVTPGSLDLPIWNIANNAAVFYGPGNAARVRFDDFWRFGDTVPEGSLNVLITNVSAQAAKSSRLPPA